MTIVSNDPSSWPTIDSIQFFSYFAVASLAAVIYDWVLTLGQEIELIWVSDRVHGFPEENEDDTINLGQRQRWSLMTVMYLAARYVGTPYSAIYMLRDLPPVSVSDAGCNNMEMAIHWANIVVAAMLGVIMIARLYAMYQGSRKMLIFLIVIFVVVNTACAVLNAIGFRSVVGEELILSGTYACSYEYEGDDYEGDVQFLITMVWILNTIWEVLALFLSVWIAVKHFRRLGPSTGSTVGNCFTMLIKSHVLYFASFVAVSCLQIGHLSPNILDSNSVGAEVYDGILQIFLVVQMFVLGPRLVLSVREYHVKLVADSDSATDMTSIAFQEHVHVSTSSTV